MDWPISIFCAVSISLILYYSPSENPYVDHYKSTVDKTVFLNAYGLSRIKVEKLVNGKMVEEKPKFGVQGQCSGVFIRSDGVILSAAHCVRKTPLMRVETADGRVFRAAVMRKEPEIDLVLLKVVPEAQESFKASKIGKMRPVGWPVYALGNPQGLKFVITQGIISGYDQDSLISDTAIQHGSSGGGLFDERSENLIGITNQIMLDDMAGGFAGISLSVGTDKIVPFLERSLPLCGY